MTTLTIKINESSKKGKAFLEFAKNFFDNEKDVEIIESGTKKAKAATENIYNPEFVAKIERSRQQLKEGKVTRIKIEDLWKQIILMMQSLIYFIR